MADDVKSILDSLSEKRSALHLANDPLTFCHRYSDPADQEIVAVIAAAFAYGNVKIILRSLEAIFSALGSSPRRYVSTFDPQQGLNVFAGFKHRFNDSRDLCALLWSIRLMLESSGSIESFFRCFVTASDHDVTNALQGYTTAVLGFDYFPVFGQQHIPRESYFPFFFPSPASGSACKRLCMLLRWLVRPADGIDLGLWHGIKPSQLIIPVDTHISRISSYLGFTRRKQADWRMAQEITAALRNFDPEDPVKYDFSLAHLGISEGCGSGDHADCRSCQLNNICSKVALVAH